MKLILYFLSMWISLICVHSISSKNKGKSQQKSLLSSKNKAQDQIEDPKSDKTKIQIEGWLKISSESFNDITRYPDFDDSSKTEDSANIINSDSLKKFRKNPAYKPGKSPSPEAFYFRVSGTNIYYTDSKYSTVVQGAIAIKNVQSTKQENNCILIEDQESDKWTLCEIEKQTPIEKWICAIQKALGQTCEPAKKQVIVKKEIQKQPIIIIPLPSPDCSRDWNYNTHGMNWVCRCNEGLEQSPINLPNPSCLSSIKFNAMFDYPVIKKQDLAISYDRNMLRMHPTNEDVKVGQITDIDGSIYQVSEIQFHTPSDHTIDGKRFDLEVQIIHKAIKGEFKKKAVLSILYKKTPGEVNVFFSKLDILNLPNPIIKHAENVLPEEFSVYQLLFNDESGDIANASPAFNYYKYNGSFTSPPCEENVIWFVASDVVPLSNTVIEFIRDSLKIPKLTKGGKEFNLNMVYDNFDGNNREVQPKRERKILFFNKEDSCSPYLDLKKNQKQIGHYEKRERNFTEYFFVDSDKPSGIPNAFVVGELEGKGEDKDKQNIQEQRGINYKFFNS